MSPTKAQQTLTYAPPLLRLAASPHDAHLLATFSQDSPVIRILDVRQPGQALLELHGHGAAVNSMEWSPSRRGTLASGGDDSLVLVWDLLNASNSTAPLSQAQSSSSSLSSQQPTLTSSNGQPAGLNSAAAGAGGVGAGAGPGATGSAAGGGGGGAGGNGGGNGGGGGSGSVDNARGPAASWQCDYEVNNVSWAPQSMLTRQGGDWLGVSGGRGIWGVSL